MDMLSTRNLAADVRDVPETWIFEHYAQLNEQLDGNEVNIRSLFNTKDTRPSMYIFLSKRFKKYWFHDFSTGKSGDAIKMVQSLFDCSFVEACDRIMSDFARAQDQHLYQGTMGRQSPSKYRVTDYKKRQWNILDAGYWTPFNISSAQLEEYYVSPLERFVMTNERNPQDSFTVSGEFIYGYFTPDGKLYKIYRPKRREGKFIKVSDYVQGIDQLTDRKCLIITSSLKDGLGLQSLSLDTDFVAPDSENSLLPDVIITQLIDRYDGRVFPLLDNDDAGIRAMKLYRDKYRLSPILLSMSKDISDSIKDAGSAAVRSRVVPAINKKLNMDYREFGSRIFVGAA